MPADLIDAFKHMTLAELTEFNRQFADVFGVDATPQPVHVKPRPDEPEPDEPTAFTVTLVGIAEPGRKIHVIKLVRELLNLGLKEAKDLVESVPVVLLEQVDADIAQAGAGRLRQAGAEVTVAAVTDPS